MNNIHDYDWEDLQKIIDYSVSIMDKPMPDCFVQASEIQKLEILPYSIPEIDLRIRAISDWKSELLVRAADKGMGQGSYYKQGGFLKEFQRNGGFESWHTKQVAEQNKKREIEKLERDAYKATIDAADSAKRSADSAEDSATSAKWAYVLAGVSAFISLIALLVSILKR